MWFWCILFGSLFLSVLWFFERTTALSFEAWVTRILPVLIVCQLFYWYGFRHAPQWITARYLMSAQTNIFGFVLILWILKEPVSIRQWVGVGLVLVGAFLVK